MNPGFARDQYGNPWIIKERNGSMWAIGLDDNDVPIIRFCDDSTIHIYLSEPTGIRHLTQIAE